MSGYQYYEFVAVDRPLDERQLAELRAMSTRARITPTSFVNTYQWGNFRGSPRKLVEEYFDAFLYLANWNTRELMIRLPRKLLDIETAARCCSTDAAGAWVAGDHVIISLTSEEETEFDEGGEGWLGSIIPIRAELAAGDLRALYLAWLLCAQAGDLHDDDLEPPVPPNLAQLTASLHSLADFLNLDEDLVAVAAAGSRVAGPGPDSDEELVRCIEDLPVEEKNALLLRAVRGDGVHLRAELLRRVRAGAYDRAMPGHGQRTVAELLAAADARRQERQRRAAEQKAEERARRERAAAIAYEKRLDSLALRVDAAWRQVDGLIEARKAAEYDQAVRLLEDLRALGTRNGTVAAFDQRLRHLRERHVRKSACSSASPGRVSDRQTVAQISMNWRGRPLTSHEVVVESIAATTSRTGLRVHAESDHGVYPTCVHISDANMAAIGLLPHDLRGDWNHTLDPHP